MRRSFSELVNHLNVPMNDKLQSRLDQEWRRASRKTSLMSLQLLGKMSKLNDVHNDINSKH